jgi:hypothetical protein
MIAWLEGLGPPLIFDIKGFGPKRDKPASRGACELVIGASAGRRSIDVSSFIETAFDGDTAGYTLQA